MATFFDDVGDDESVVMTGAEVKATVPLDPVTAGTLEAAINDPDPVRISRVVRGIQVRDSLPPTVYIQGGLNGGTVYILTRLNAHWDWMLDSVDTFQGTNVAGTGGAIGDANIRQGFSTTGEIIALLIGATDPANATVRMGVA